VAHVGINIRIRIFKSGNHATVQPLMPVMQAPPVNEASIISDFASTIVGIIYFCIVAILTTALNKMNITDVTGYPNILILYAFTLIFPSALMLSQYAFYYIRLQPLRKFLTREIKNKLGFAQ
jgi:hypothetical protein